MADDLAALTQTLGHRYRLERELGRGGMGTVYLARDRSLDRPVALKVLPPSLAEVPELRERFLRETRTAAGFSHPNIVPVFSVEEHGQALAFAMGFVEGESLAAKVAREGPMSQRAVVRLLQDVAYALAYAHGRGVVHRDIKPDNIMIERATGRALVMDFGIARAITPVSDAKAGLTRVGEVVGTPEYMSPEQATGDHVDGRADLYSLGLVAWYALTGDTAMSGDSTQRILVRQLTEPVPPLGPLRPDLTPALVAVVDRCCEKSAEARYATAEALVEALDATQLVAAEIPVAVRLLATELSSVTTRALSAVAMLALGTAMILSNGNGNVLAIGLVVAATAWVIFMNALREIRRLRGAGYSAAELQRLLGMTLAEQDEERARRALDPVLRKRRRFRVILSWAMLLWQGSVFVMLRSQADANGNVKLTGNVAGVTFFASLLASAMAMAILLTSPFRRSFPQRLFAFTWLGPIGHAVFRWSAPRGSASASVATLAPPTRPAPVAVTTRPVPTATANTPSLERLAADVAQLTARVDALETRRPRES
ncbi:MAG: serine/threonine protein kinase [Gemmatimonadaceae bacterium]|nr:serine/threonine protein kinase [Gemmatimonadaceae bacterium]